MRGLVTLNKVNRECLAKVTPELGNEGGRAPGILRAEGKHSRHRENEHKCSEDGHIGPSLRKASRSVGWKRNEGRVEWQETGSERQLRLDLLGPLSQPIQIQKE